MKGRTRKTERKCLFKCAPEREREREREKKRKREEEGEEIPVPTEWESNTFSTVPRFRSAPDPPLYLPSSLLIFPSCPPLTLRTSRRSLRRVFSLAVLTLSVYMYYAKRVNRRWPREPDTQCVINTDALVVSFPSFSPPVPFAYSSFQSVPYLCRSSRLSKTRTGCLNKY